MSKKIIQDIIIKKKTAQRTRIEEKKDNPPIRIPRRKQRKIISFKSIFWFAFFALLIFAFFSALGFFSSVSIKITPRQEFIAVDSDLKAKRGGDGGILPFETIRMKRTEKFVGKSTGVEKVEDMSSGKIVIYNAFSSKSQVLIARTRFETPEGKIYRIKKRITVPGAKIKKGKIVPSSIEAVVYADKFGKEYNIGLSDFSIPGFKGDPRYKKFYARSKTEMKGGYEGTVSIITKKDIAEGSDNLKKKIKNYLLESLSKQIPLGFLLYKGASIFNFSELENNPVPGDRIEKFEYGLNGEVVGFLIKKSSLEKEIVKRYLKDSMDEVGIVNIDGFVFKLFKYDREKNEIIFNLKGKAHFVWKIDTDSLLGDLVKSPRSEYNLVFKKYPAIEKAEIIFRPYWWHYLPKNKSHVHFEQILKSG
ncbi:MAG TPA: hypothetical protein ENG99_01000 [bacterium]|nr:hypothetical protein [bacterium]